MPLRGNTPTKISNRKVTAEGITVIEFIDRPRYRGFSVDISSNLPLELLAISVYRGDLRVEVHSASKAPNTCQLIIEERHFNVKVGYKQEISVGIEET